MNHNKDELIFEYHPAHNEFAHDVKLIFTIPSEHCMEDIIDCFKRFLYAMTFSHLSIERAFSDTEDQ